MWYNPIMRWMLSSPMHFLVSNNMMLLTYTGRKSGRKFTTPVSYLKVGEDLYTISSRDRVWWRNLRGGAEVALRFKGEKTKAQAESFEKQDEVTGYLNEYFQASPQLAKYMKVETDSGGKPNPEQVANLAREKVIVRMRLK